MPDTEPLVTHASSGNSFMTYAPLEPRKLVSSRKFPKHLIDYVCIINKNLYMKPNAWWHNNAHGVMRSMFLIC